MRTDFYTKLMLTGRPCLSGWLGGQQGLHQTASLLRQREPFPIARHWTEV